MANRRGAGRPRLDDLASREESLLQVARAILIERGYEGASLNMIARRAGVSKQTIYAKYGGKAGLLRAMLQHVADHDYPHWLQGDNDLPLEEGLLVRIRRLLEINKSEIARAITAISQREVQTFPEFREEMLRSKRRNQQDPLQHYFEEFRRRGIIGDVDCAQLAEMVLWMVAQDLVSSATTGEPITESEQKSDRKARFITDLIVRGIRA